MCATIILIAKAAHGQHTLEKQNLEAQAFWTKYE